MLLYLISDRRALFSPQESFSEAFAHQRLLKLAENAAQAGIDLFQLREKDLPSRAAFELAAEMAQIFRSTQTRLLVNDRFDLALGAGAHGVHLTSRSMRAADVRRCVPVGFLIGVSTHSQEEIALAEPGADFAVCGPLFEMPSKPKLGLEKFSAFAHQTGLPLIALGGITVENIHQLKNSGVAGIASIRLFAQGAWSDSKTFSQYISTLRSAWNNL